MSYSRPPSPTLAYSLNMEDYPVECKAEDVTMTEMYSQSVSEPDEMTCLLRNRNERTRRDMVHKAKHVECEAEHVEYANRAKMLSEHASQIFTIEKMEGMSNLLKKRVKQTWRDITIVSNLIDMEQKFGNASKSLEDAEKDIREAKAIMGSIDTFIPYRFIYTDEKLRGIVDKHGELGELALLGGESMVLCVIS